ncbi:MAG: hypothetical protein CME62_17245 [Halobacteriovoraceae bacterium]|nr:hypothetical protein [Halobacteriovoraceae bacterium]|tara:strand:+ start:5248 stop:6156 length:909 start_codon:yes stop_codon:yes gene_type:complete
MKFLILLTFILSTYTHSKLIDKVAGVINDKIFTLSEVERVKNTIPVRKEIAPFIFTQDKYSNKEVLRLLQNSFIIKNKLEELGFIVSDDQVEDRINETQKQLQLSRDQLLQFLNSKGITFNEYFEILRDAMEYNIFNRRIIAPLVTITDQELKTEYYKNTKSKKTINYIYEVIDYNIKKDKLQKEDIARMPSVLEKYIENGNLPEIYSEIEMDSLGKLAGEDVPKNIRNVLRNTNEKKFSKPILIDNRYHSFYLISKKIIDSKDFLRAKEAIYNRLFMERSMKLSKNWFSREALNYYILDNL